MVSQTVGVRESSTFAAEYTGACPGTCQHAARDGIRVGVPRSARGRLCGRCEDGVRRHLASFPELYAQCEELLVDTAAPNLRERVSGGGDRGKLMPLNESVAAARTAIMGTLASWSGLVVSERRITRRPRRLPAELSTFLIRHVDWLADHDAAGDFAREVAETADLAHTSVRPRRRVLSHCPDPDCESRIYMPERGAGGQGARQLRCEAGHVWEAHQWLLLASELRRTHRRRAGDRDVHSAASESRI